MRTIASREESIFLPSAASRCQELVVEKSFGRNEEDITVRVVPVSGVTLALNDEPPWEKVSSTFGVGWD